MKNRFLFLCIAFVLYAGTAKADSLKDLLGGDLGNLGNALGNMAQETIAQNKDLKISDIEGTWIASGPAVSLKSENMLEQAGGAAIAGIAENKIMPYYEKLGIDGSQIVFDADGKFTLTIKKLPVKGTISKQDDGTFKMEFLSGISIAENLRTMNAYLQKTSNSLSLTVDAKKLLDIVEKVASKADSSIIGTATKLLDSLRSSLHRIEIAKTIILRNEKNFSYFLPLPVWHGAVIGCGQTTAKSRRVCRQRKYRQS